MESCVDAHSLISLSLMKIQRSRVQRGGIRLHRNLLVSGVIRSARQVYIREKYAELYRIQRYEEVMTVCDGIQELDPLHVDAEDAHGHEQARDGDCGDAPGHRGAATPAEHGGTPGCCASLLPGGGKLPEPAEFRSCCMEPPLGAQGEHVPPEDLRYCDRTTVLDLDTHVVTTVENGLLHGDDCCCVSAQGAPNPARKRRVEPEEPGDFTAGRKRLKPEEECPFSGSELSDSTHISNLISIFGSGFSGLLSRNQDLDLICSKQALASLGAWTRVIVAF